MKESITEYFKETSKEKNQVISTPNSELRFKPKVEKDNDGNIIWNMYGYCDSTWISDQDYGRSVEGFFWGTPISWKLKMQQHFTLLSSEVEHCSSTELVKEMLYEMQILEFMEIKVKLPMWVYIDNICAIQMDRTTLVRLGQDIRISSQ